MPLSPPPADFYFYFPAPLKKVLIHNVHTQETSKSYFSDNQWKVEAVYVNWLLFAGKNPN